MDKMYLMDRMDLVGTVVAGEAVVMGKMGTIVTVDDC